MAHQNNLLQTESDFAKALGFFDNVVPKIVKANETAETEEVLESPGKKRKAAWIDEDDENTKVGDAVLTFQCKLRNDQLVAAKTVSNKKYNELLREKFIASVGPTPSWANADRSIPDSEDNDEDALTLGKSLLVSASTSLSVDHLDFHSLSDLNTDNKTSKFSNSSAFVKTGLKTTFAVNFPISLVTTKEVRRKGNGNVWVFEVGAKECPQVEHAFFENFHINASSFLPGDKKFIVGSNGHQHFFVYDMEARREIRIPWGSKRQPRGMLEIHIIDENTVMVVEGDEMSLVDTRTWRWTTSLRPPSAVSTAAVTSDTIYSHSASDSQVYVWDIKSRCSRHFFSDEGCIRGTAIAASPNSRFVACGSNVGIVNVYDARKVESCPAGKAPRPVCVLSNLVTSVDCLQFNHSSEALAFASSQLQDAVKIAHIPSMRVYQNFPTTTRLGHVSDCSFSPNSGYLAVCGGNARVHRYRLRHFKQY